MRLSPVETAIPWASDDDRLGTGQVPDELEDLAQVQHRVDALAAREQRHQALEVVDRGGVGVRRLRRVPGAPEVLVFLAASSLRQ